MHLATLGYPVVGDEVYGRADANLDRYFLHAHKLTLKDPSGTELEFQSPLPPELAIYLHGLK